MPFNPKYFSNGIMQQLLPRASAFTTYITPDDIVIGIFQGERGGKPELDFKVRILLPGESNRPILPPHSYWVADLMLKCVLNSKEVAEIAQFYLEFYEKCKPFQSQDERNGYKLQTIEHIRKNYSHIELKHTLSLDYVAIMIELFCLNEKQTEGAYWFKGLLQKVKDYAEGKANYIDLMEASKAGFGG